MSPSPSQAERFVCLRLQADDPSRGEWALAEAFAAGAVGVEEQVEDDRVTFAVYAPRGARDPVHAAVTRTGARVLSVSPVPDEDWSEAWKRDLAPIVVSTRLALRPSFVPFEPAPGQQVLELDPGQAFGTGAHESTRLALEAIDALPGGLSAEHRVLDVGTGTGVLALAALALGAGRATALDLDPLAAPAARENALRNRLAPRLDVFVGGVEALAPGACFDLVVANLLASELHPVLPALAGCLASDGRLVLSGLLADQTPEVESRALGLGLAVGQALRRTDASAAVWSALIMRRAHAPPRR